MIPYSICVKLKPVIPCYNVMIATYAHVAAIGKREIPRLNKFIFVQRVIRIVLLAIY